MTNCPNCGAVIDLTAKMCAYCGTPYRWALASLSLNSTLEIEFSPKYAESIVASILTPNETRGRLGLPPVKVFFGDAPPEDTTGLWIDTSLEEGKA